MMNKHKNTLFHFLTSSKLRLLRHVLFGLILLPIALAQSFFVLGNLGGTGKFTIYIFGIGFWGFLLVLIYFNIFYLIPRFLLRHKYTLYAISLFAAVYMVVIIKYFMASYIMHLPRTINFITVIDWLSNATLYTICIASSSVTKLIRVWLDESEQIEKLENEHIKKDIEEFKNRISPKILYTALTNAASQTITHPKRATEILLNLSKVLRYQLYDCNRMHTLLDSEVAFVQNYMRLHQYSIHPLCEFSVVMKDKIKRFVPPGLFKSLIEIILAEKPSKVRMMFMVQDSKLICTCESQHETVPNYDMSPIKQRLNNLQATYELNISHNYIALSLC